MQQHKGIVYQNGWRPFCKIQPIKRGKNQGQFWITLTRGRNKDGSIKPGRRVKVSAKSIKFVNGQKSPVQQVIL